MADISITAGNVLSGEGARIQRGTALENVTAGRVAYQRPSDRKLGLADNNAAGPEVRVACGVYLHGSAAGQPATYQEAGEINVGPVLTAGLAYYLSDTPGVICPDGDVGVGENVVLIGVAKTTSILMLAIRNTGVTR